MQEKLKRAVNSPLFLPVLAAPVLFGLGALLLYQRDGAGALYYVLYSLQHLFTATLFFLGLHRVFRAIPVRGMPRALTAAFPILISLSVYHFAIAFFDAFAVQFEDGPTSLVYALLSLLTDAVVGEWLLLLLSAAAAYLFFLRGEVAPEDERAAHLLCAVVYLAYLLVGRVSEFLSHVSAHLGVATENATVSFLLLSGADLLLSAFGYLVLYLFAKRKNSEVAK